MKRSLAFFLIVGIAVSSCKDEALPKPKAMLRLEFPVAQYETYNGDCDFSFDSNQLSKIDAKSDCSMILDYPKMKGSIYITYKKVDDNLKTLLTDAQKLSYEHVVKADNISEQPFINQEDKVYGMFYEVTGDAASQSQFYATDSLNHFVTGSLYFYAKPNYDSIYPAAIYLQKDIRRIMESLHWKESR